MKFEFIGLELEVVDSNNSSLIGKKGKILDETKESFVIRIDKEIRILKRGNTFKINNKLINGDEISKRPEERLKLK